MVNGWREGDERAMQGVDTVRETVRKEMEREQRGGEERRPVREIKLVRNMVGEGR